MRNLKLQYPGCCVFYDKLNMPCVQNVNAKSNFDLMDGKFFGYCIAVQNFKKI